MTNESVYQYDIHKHRHMFSAWAAGRAASVKGCRFPVEAAYNIINHLNFASKFVVPSQLPSANEIDDCHQLWRISAIEFVKNNPSSGFKSETSIHNFTHGIAAKIINIYMKSMFVCGGYHEHPSVMALHPPVDSLLLSKLHKKNIKNPNNPWAPYKKGGWSKFSSDQYEEVISYIRIETHNKPLWMIEEFWPGHKD